MTGAPSTLAELPLAELIWRLSEHLPGVFRRFELGMKYVTALGPGSVTAWPEQPHQPATVQAFPSAAQALAAALLAEAASLGWEVQLGSVLGGWDAAVSPPSHDGWLTGQGRGAAHEFPMLQAVAQAVLMGHELLAGRLEVTG